MKANFIWILLGVGLGIVAHADTYLCKNSNGYNGFGDTIKAEITGAQIKLTETELGLIAGTQDTGYTPRAKNKGSIRFDVKVNNNIGSGCRDAQVVLNKALATGKNGKLTIIYDCDSDGNGPTFYAYSCSK